jgi:circadian clock protein KaiC
VFPLSGDQITRLGTGVPGLDEILGGGLPQGSMVFLVGGPGVGKTILAQQLSFQAALAGRPVQFLTTLSEPHDKLLAFLRSLAFFDPEIVGNGIELINLQSLMAASPEETVESIVSAVRKGRVSLVVIDDLNGLRGFLASERAAREFLYELSASLGLLGTTLLVNVQADPGDTVRHPEFGVADAILGLLYVRRGGDHRRQLEVLKLRGAQYLDGLHSYTITSTGVSCYPRQESLPLEANPGFGAGRAGFGLTKLDAMLGGGLNEGTATMLLGSPGTGKTLGGLHFLVAGAAKGEPGLLLGFQESAAQLLAKAEAFGLDLAGAVGDGTIQLVTRTPVRMDPDMVVQDVLARVDRGGVRRLVIDSSRELERTLDSGRAPEFLSAVIAWLRARQVTTLLTREITQIVGSELDFSDTAASVLAENIVLLRLVEYRGELHRVISVVKMRFSAHDHRLHEFAIADRGISVLGELPSGEGLLTGVARGIASKVG